MGYRFAEVYGKEIFVSGLGLTGKQVLVERYEDCTITHRFVINGVVKVKGRCAWYSISNHSTVIDKTDAIKAQLKDQSDALVELAEIIEGMGVE